MQHVSYIDKTHAYYRGQGYTQDYQYAHNEESPFTPLAKPLAESRLALISTAAILMLDEAGKTDEPVRLMGSNTLDVYPVPGDLPASRLRSASEDHDRAQSDMADIDAFFPITRLAEFAAEGVVGSLAPHFYRTLPNYSHRKVATVDAPEILRRCRTEGVEVALLAPV